MHNMNTCVINLRPPGDEKLFKVPRTRLNTNLNHTSLWRSYLSKMSHVRVILIRAQPYPKAFITPPWWRTNPKWRSRLIQENLTPNSNSPNLMQQRKIRNIITATLFKADLREGQDWLALALGIIGQAMAHITFFFFLCVEIQSQAITV